MQVNQLHSNHSLKAQSASTSQFQAKTLSKTFLKHAVMLVGGGLLARVTYGAYQTLRTLPAREVLKSTFEEASAKALPDYDRCLSIVCYRSNVRPIGDGHCMVVSQPLDQYDKMTPYQSVCHYKEEQANDILLESGPENFRYEAELGVLPLVQLGSFVALSGWEGHEKPSAATYIAAISAPITHEQQQFMLEKVDLLVDQYTGYSWGAAGLNCVEGAILLWESVTGRELDVFSSWAPRFFPPNPTEFINYYNN